MGKGKRGGGLGPPPVIRPPAPRTAPWPPPPACPIERPRMSPLSWRPCFAKPHANVAADVALVSASAGQQGAAPAAHICGHFWLGFCRTCQPPHNKATIKRTALQALKLNSGLEEGGTLGTACPSRLCHTHTHTLTHTHTHTHASSTCLKKGARSPSHLWGPCSNTIRAEHRSRASRHSLHGGAGEARLARRQLTL